MAEGDDLTRPATRYLLDTNVALALIRGNPLGRSIDARFGLSVGVTRALISVVSVGELMSIAERAGWGEEKRGRFDNLLRELVWIDINEAKVLDTYAKLDCHAISIGRKLIQNDLWIAACSRATASTLLTTDRDFDAFHPAWIDRIWIDPDPAKAP